MNEQIEWCIDHNIGMEDCSICRPKTCPVSIYSRGRRIIVGEATFSEEDGEQIASVRLHQHMPNFLEAFTEGIVTGLTIAPERAALHKVYDNLIEKERKKITFEGEIDDQSVAVKSIEGETIQYNHKCECGHTKSLHNIHQVCDKCTCQCFKKEK